MFTTEELEAVKQVGTAVSAVGSTVLEEYTRYYVYGSIVWIVAALVFGFFAWRVNVSHIHKDFDPIIMWMIKIIAAIVAALMFFSNAGNLVAPKAAAIHQIIKDVRGGK